MPPPAVDSEDFKFNFAFRRVVNCEGGYSDDTKDPGNWTGKKAGDGDCLGTNCGISGHSYPKEDIKQMTPARAGVIYRRDFWIEGLPLPIGYALFDSGVNIGKVTAILKLQRAMGVKADGVVDAPPGTL